MAAADDIAGIIEQEARLVFRRFDEAAGFALGCRLRDFGLARAQPIVIDIQTWDRPLFYAALAGSTADNANWARRKRNVVQAYHKSTYRMVLEQERPDRTFPPGHARDPGEFVLAGGGFPIRIEGAGVIAAVAVSGLPERQDHALVVEALCAELGQDFESLALPDQPR